MSTVAIPPASLARLRARYAAFQDAAQTVVEALGLSEVPGVNLNLDNGVFEVPGDGALEPQLGERANGVPV